MADITRRVPGCDDDCEGERGERGKRGKRGKRGNRGHRGHDGHDGNDGQDGAAGAAGATGATGATGAPGSSAIIPFASGPPVDMVHVGPDGPLLDTGGVIGFGVSESGVPVGAEGSAIDPTVSPGTATNMAFSLPRDGALTQLSVFFSNVVQVDIPLGTTLNIITQLFISAAPDNVFTPLPAAVVEFSFVGPVTLAIGETENATVALAVPVENEDRLILVSRITVEGTDIATSITGYISAGLAIS